MVAYFEQKTKFIAIQWTGSNQSAVDNFLAMLPSIDSHYGTYTNVSTSVSGTTLTVQRDPGSASMQFPQDHWVVEGIAPGLGSGIGLVKSASNPTMDPTMAFIEQ